MRIFVGLALAFAICGSACAQDVQTSENVVEAQASELIQEPQLRTFSKDVTTNEDGSVTTIKTQIPNPAPTPISCIGVAQQGGAVLCQTSPNAKVKVARSEKDFYFESADENGHIIIGFDRDEKSNFVEVAGDRVTFDLEPREYDTSRINGLPKNMVSEYTPEELKRIRAATARKKIGFASRAEEMGFKNGFILPIQEDYIKTTNFGAQRILNGEPKRPHYGVDLGRA